MNQPKLYVWEGVLTDYTEGIAFALAHSVGEASVHYSTIATLMGNMVNVTPPQEILLEKMMCQALGDE